MYDGDQLGLLQCAKVGLVVLEQGMDLEFVKVGLISIVKIDERKQKMVSG